MFKDIVKFAREDTFTFILVIFMVSMFVGECGSSCRVSIDTTAKHPVDIQYTNHEEKK